MWPWYTAERQTIREPPSVALISPDHRRRAAVCWPPAGAGAPASRPAADCVRRRSGRLAGHRRRVSSLTRPSRPPCSAARSSGWLYWADRAARARGAGRRGLGGAGVLPAGRADRDRVRVPHRRGPGTVLGRVPAPGEGDPARPDPAGPGPGTAPAQVGIPLHEVAPVTRTALWLPLENATGVIAPQQSGKTLMDLIHKVIHAPGGLLVTSTKLDLFLLTATARERAGSTVHVLDLTGAAAWHRQGALEHRSRLHHRQDRETPRPGPGPRHHRPHHCGRCRESRVLRTPRRSTS